MMPRSPDLAIFVVTDRQTDKQTDGRPDCFTPCACARGKATETIPAVPVVYVNSYTQTIITYSHTFFCEKRILCACRVDHFNPFGHRKFMSSPRSHEFSVTERGNHRHRAHRVMYGRAASGWTPFSISNI